VTSDDQTAPDDGRDLARFAAAVADAKKGEHTVVLDVGEVLAITGYFVITSAPNTRLVRTIADEVELKVKQSGGPPPLRVEGLRELTWVLLDYGDVVVHVFHEEMRQFYDLERLYRDVPRVAWTPLVAVPDGDASV
jgi:ribosome-associated protein